ncbi:MAG TPA: ZPR1 zinc finger domain-containing protein [Methanoculleus sp.]|nr:ZPR1 zinc finger domain-containing protein [Methanoculleus sp.]
MRRVVPGPCPVCNTEIEYLYQTENIPFFSDILLMTASCECGYRLVDTIILGAGEPVRYTLAVETEEDLEARVVRSTTGTIEVPELGIKVEPGPICEAFISNVEGVLYRFESVVDRVLSWAEGEQRDVALALKAKINDARHLAFPFTVILEDPDGNSALISPNAAQEPLEVERKGE